MIEDEVTWVVAADGRNSRVFEERRRHGPLHEVEAMAMRLDEHDRPRAAHPGGSVHQSGGFGRDNMYEASPEDAAEDRFLKRLAAALEGGVSERRCEALVLIAPPRALGALRRALSAQARGLVRYEEAKDRVREDAATLRQRLRDLRTPA